MINIVNIVLTIIAILIAGRVLPGVRVKGFGTALIVAVLLGLAMPTIEPALKYLTLPVNVFTLGGVSLLANGLLILIVASVIPGFSVDSFVAALLFCFVTSTLHVFISIALASA